MKMDKVLETLKEDYALRASLKRKHLKVQDELEDEIEDLEQSLITSKIIPELEQYAKTLLNDLECEVYLAIKKDVNGVVEVYEEFCLMSDANIMHTEPDAPIEECDCAAEDPAQLIWNYPVLTVPAKFHETQKSDRKTFLYKLKVENGDDVKGLHISDSWSCESAVIKRNDRYGIFVCKGMDPNYPTPEYWSLPQPFIFSDVRICCESYVGDNGFVAVCRDGMWGAVEMSFDYRLQLVVPIQYRTWKEVAIEVEKLLGQHLKAEWLSFKKFQKCNNGDPSHNPKADLTQSTKINNAILLNENNKDIATGRDLRITFDDGTVFEGNNAKDTFVNALKKIGLDKIHPVGITCAGYNLVDTRKRTDKGREWQQKIGHFYVYIYFSNPTKVDFLQRIADYYHLNIKIEAIKKA